MALFNVQYDEIMREYQYRQNTALRDLEQRRERIYAALPSLTELDRQRADLMTAAAIARVNGREPDEDVSEQLAQLADRRCRLLASAGYTPEDLQPRSQCPDCHDTGYIGQKRCHCFDKLVIEHFYAQPELQSVLQKDTFANFRLDCYSSDERIPRSDITVYEQMRANFDYCIDYAAHFDERHPSLIMFGGVGLGKTHLSHAIMGELIRSHHSVIYYPAYEMIEALADEVFGRKESDISQYLTGCDLLIIDDLGTELTNEFMITQLFQILNRRIASDKATIISTNLTMNGLRDLYSERISSRIMEAFEFLPFFGEDYRLHS